MTLTLEEVKNIRFPMARRPNEGYRANEVDDFVDRAVDTFQTLVDENERLKAQLQAVQADQGARGDDQQSAQLRAELDRLQRENSSLRDRVESAQHAANNGADTAELARLRQSNSELEQRATELGRQLAQAQAAPAAMGASGDGKLERMVVTTSSEASPAVIRLVQLATEQAESVVTEAEANAKHKRAEAERVVEETTRGASERAQQIEAQARQNAERLTADARTEADRLTRDARGQAERLTNEAKANADQVNVDARKRREELFRTLESERENFVNKIDELKSWEANYRSSLTEHLRSQAEAVEKAQLSPQNTPGLVADQRNASATPRLDALLADKN